MSPVAAGRVLVEVLCGALLTAGQLAGDSPASQPSERDAPGATSGVTARGVAPAAHGHVRIAAAPAEPLCSRLGGGA